MEELNQPVKVVEVLNPFRPADERKETILDAKLGETPSAALVRAGVNPDDYTISVKGEILPPEKATALALSPGDEILILPTLQSGFWGELGMLAMMAGLTILSAGIGGAIFGAASVGAMGMTFGTTEAMMLGGAIALGGAALMAWSVLGMSSQAPMLPSATYDPTGQKQLARAGVPVPKGYGKFAWKGNFISNYADFEGKDQYDCVLACFGFGKAKSITNILLNGRPANQYRDVNVWTRLGTNDQTPIDGFNKTVNTYPQETELLNASGPTVVPGTGTDIQALQIGIKFPGGLIRYDNHGNPKEVSYAYKVEVSPHGQNTWTAPIFPRTTTDVVTTNTNGYQTYPYWVVVPTDRFSGSGIVYSTDTNTGAHYPGESWTATQSVKVYDVNNTNTTENVTLTGEWQPCDPNLNQQHVTDWWGGWRIVSAMTPSAFFDVCNVYGLAAGQWDARITFWGAGPHNQSIPEGDVTDGHYQASGWLWYINELTFSDLAYPNMILVGVRAKTSGQISGASLNIQATIEHDLGEDTVIPSQLSSFETDNPAIVAYDLITNPLYGMGYDPKYVDIPSFVAWAQNNDLTRTNSDSTTSRQWIFNGIFDQSGDGWTALGKIGTMSSCLVGMPGGKFTAILDAPDEPVQLFTVNNMVKDSFKESWVSLDNRTNLIEATFADAARTYRTDLPVSVMTADDIQSGIPPRSTRTTLLGCTSRDQAWRWCYQQLLHTKLALRSISFKASLSAVACRTGNLIAVQHDVPQWAYGGIVQSGSTASVVNIDRTDLPAFATGQGWTLSVQHPTLLRGTATIASVTPGSVNTVTLTAVPPSGRVLRLVSADGSFETSVRGVTGDVLEVDSLGSLSAGQTVSLYDQDVIEVSVVSAVTGTAITVEAPFSQAPVTDAPYAYGQSNGTQPAKLFRVTTIKRSSDWAVTVNAVEYQPAVYEPQIPQYGLVVTAPTVSAPIQDLTLAVVYQNGAVAGNTGGTVLSIGWVNGPGTKGAQIEASINGAAFQFVARVVGSGYQMPVTAGVTVEIRVTGYDSLGILDPNDAMTASTDTTSTVTTSDIPAPTNLSIEDDSTTVMTLSNGNTLPRMLVSWTPPADTAAAKIQVQYQFTTSNSTQPSFLSPVLDSSTNTYQSTWMDGGTVDASATSVFVNGIEPFEYQNINVRVRSIRNSGAASSWVETGNHSLPVKYPTWSVVGDGGSGPILTYGSGGPNLFELQPAQAGADKTSSNNAAGVQAGNTYRLAQDVIDSINTGGGLNFAASGHTGTLDFATYIANRGAADVTYGSGATVESLQPSQAGADVTSQNTAKDTSAVNGVAAATVTANLTAALDNASNALSTANAKAEVTVAASAPASPATGDVWYNTSVSPAAAVVWNGSAWVAADSAAQAAASSAATAANAASTLAGTKAKVTIGATAPASPSPGDMWINTTVTPQTCETWSGSAWVAAADITSQNTAKDTSAVSGQPSATVAQGATGINHNLIPDSDFKFGSSYWTLGTKMQVKQASTDTGGNQIEWIAGASGDQANNAYSAPIPVSAGATYTLSGYIDANLAQSGDKPNWNVLFSNGGFGAGAYATPGQHGRYSFTFTVPSGVSSLQIVFGGNISANVYVWASAPQLQLGSIVTAYQPGIMDSTTGYLKAGTSQIDLSSSIHLNKTLDYLPNGTARYASAESGADSTTNHHVAVPGSFPASVTYASGPTTGATLGTVTVDAAGPDDLFLLLGTFAAVIPSGMTSEPTPINTIQYTVDGGSTNYAFGSPAPTGTSMTYMGAITGLAAGTHTIAIVAYTDSVQAESQYSANSCFAVVQHFSSSSGGFNAAPSGGSQLAKPSIS